MGLAAVIAIHFMCYKFFLHFSDWVGRIRIPRSASVCHSTSGENELRVLMKLFVKKVYLVYCPMFIIGLQCFFNLFSVAAIFLTKYCIYLNDFYDSSMCIQCCESTAIGASFRDGTGQDFLDPTRTVNFIIYVG